MQVFPRADGIVELSVGDITGLTGRFKLTDLPFKPLATDTAFSPFDGAPYIICVTKDGPEQPWGMYFGADGFVIDRVSILANYWPDTQELECFPDYGHGWKVVQWFKDMQDEWRAEVCSRRDDERQGKGQNRTLQ